MIRVLLIALCLTSLAAAGVSERDLFEPGDGLLTYDEVSGREWLDFSVSSELLQEAQSTELNLPLQLQDFQVATVADVESLLQSAEVERFEAWNLPLGESTTARRVIDLMRSTLTLRDNVIGDSYSAGGLVAESLESVPDQDRTAAVLVHTHGEQRTPRAHNPIFYRATGGYYKLKASEYPFANGPVPLLQAGAERDRSPIPPYAFDPFVGSTPVDPDNDGILSVEEQPSLPTDPYYRVEIGAEPIPREPVSLSQAQEFVNDLFLAGLSRSEVVDLLDVVLSDTETVTVTLYGEDGSAPILQLEVPVVESFNDPSRTVGDFAPRTDGVTLRYRAPPELLAEFFDFTPNQFPPGVVSGPIYYVGNADFLVDSGELAIDTLTPLIADDLASNPNTATAIIGDLDGDGEIENGEVFGVFTDFGDVYELNIFYSHTAGTPAYWLFREATPIPEPSAAWLTIAACLISLRLRALA